MIKVCSSCHSPDLAASEHLSTQDWHDLVNGMAARGADATDAEFGEIIKYLAKSFPAQQAQGSPAVVSTPKDSVSGLKANFATNASSQNFISGTVSVSFVPPQDGQKNWLTVCLMNEKRACLSNFSAELMPGTKEYKFEIDEQADHEWASKPEVDIQACIGDAKQVNDYFALPPEEQATRDKPVCAVKKLVQTTLSPRATH